MDFTRSVINASVRRAKEVFAHFGIRLPAWAYWTPAQWDVAGPEFAEVRDCLLGWDVTDFGSGEFSRIGRTLFTLRNGKAGDARYPKSYAEKLILDPENQRAPPHFHRSKREDIICRCGGNVLVQLRAAALDGRASPDRLAVQVDGRTVEVPAGGMVRLAPGMSVCLPPRTIHQFWGEPGTGWLLDGVRYTVGGEVSSVCDDRQDNCFLVPYGVRFPKIVEDEQREAVLCHEYPPPARRA
jgi:hypothetical protein